MLTGDFWVLPEVTRSASGGFATVGRMRHLAALALILAACGTSQAFDEQSFQTHAERRGWNEAQTKRAADAYRDLCNERTDEVFVIAWAAADNDPDVRQSTRAACPKRVAELID